VAVKSPRGDSKPAHIQQHMRTSIGNSFNSRPKNKHKRRSFKAYRGQGKK
tara:strand:+ start:146 stop:295 length:150 start_codon:yes stop_codon:yes gene_type:complete